MSSGTVILLVLLGGGGGGLFFWFRKRRLAREKEAAETEAAERRQLDAELSVLSDDVVGLESEVTLHPEARNDYDAGVARHQAAQAAMGHTGDKVDLVRVGRVIEEGRYAMNRARARVDGREPPPRRRRSPSPAAATSPRSTSMSRALLGMSATPARSTAVEAGTEEEAEACSPAYCSAR